MGRLIDIDRLCNDLVKRWSIADKNKENLIRAVMADVVTPIVVSQPTVEAVPVVRCKDCKFYYRMTAETGICQLACPHFGNDGFCSEGEWKDGEHDRG